jgi:hypothetical protein
VDLHAAPRVLDGLLCGDVLEQRGEPPRSRPHPRQLALDALLLCVREGALEALQDPQLLRALFGVRRGDGERAQGEQVRLHLVEVVRDHLVLGDRLAHRASTRGVLAREAQGGLDDPDALERDAHAGVVHEHQHVLEALAAGADELRRGVFVRERGGHRRVVPELVLDAVDRDEALSLTVW